MSILIHREAQLKLPNTHYTQILACRDSQNTAKHGLNLKYWQMVGLYLKHRPQLIISLYVLLGGYVFGISLFGIFIVKEYKGLVMVALHFSCVCMYGGAV